MASDVPASDVLVIGGGVFGLWVARACLRRGWSVTLADAGRIGGGASGGVVGALAPFAPAPWTAKKAFQRDALRALPDEIAALEAETGVSTGYARCGRLVPLASEAARERVVGGLDAARARWDGAEVRVSDAEAPGWLDAPPAGARFDGFSARIAPRACCAALRAAVALDGARLLEGWRMTGWTAGSGAVFDGARAPAAATVVAAGWESFGLLASIAPSAPEGGGEHGQAALLAARAPEGAPAIQGDGLWIVPQAGGVAVGSTSERGRTDRRTDAALDDVIARARALCPPLRDAPVIERWAGIRPRAATRDPVLGPVADGLWVATGGFKIGFGVAHRCGEAVAAMIAGERLAAPEGFLAAASAGP